MTGNPLLRIVLKNTLYICKHSNCCAPDDWQLNKTNVLLSIVTGTHFFTPSDMQPPNTRV